MRAWFWLVQRTGRCPDVSAEDELMSVREIADDQVKMGLA